MNFGQWLGLISLIISFYIVWQIRQILLLLFTAVVLATALNRLIRNLEKWGIKRKLAIPITLISISLLAILVFNLLIPPFVDQFQELLKLLPQGFEQLYSQIRNLESQNFDWLPPLPSFAELLDQLQLTEIFQNFVSFFSNSLNAFLQVLLVLILTVMLLYNPHAYRRTFILLFPSFYRRRADEILSQCELALGNWLTGITINCLFIGISCGLGLWILQVRLLLAHSLLAGILNFIPNIGPTMSLVFPVTIALLDDPWKIAPIFIWYFIVQNIESYWLSPTVMAKQVSLLPAITLSAQIFCAATLGLLGLILALPLTVVAKTWFETLLFEDILDQWESNPENTN
jgi:predicted PurR-regulated permease PerM